MSLTRVIIMSRMKVRFDEEDMDSLGQQSSANNEEHHITGLLTSYGNYFIHVIEGPELAIKALLEVMDSDPRHEEMTIIASEHINERVFRDWSIQHFDLTQYFESDPRTIRKRFRRVLKHSKQPRDAIRQIFATFPKLIRETDLLKSA